LGTKLPQSAGNFLSQEEKPFVLNVLKLRKESAQFLMKEHEEV